MSKQFFIFLVVYLIEGIGDLIDTGFGNGIDIDSVCVLSAYTVITWCTHCIYSIGTYAYKVIQSKAKECCFLQCVTSILLGCVLFSLSNVIPRIYTLTDVQYDLFSTCLRVHAISLPVIAFGSFIGYYLELNCKNKEAIYGDILFYIAMILSDFFVVHNGYGLTILVWCTFGSYIIYGIYGLIVTKAYKANLKINFKTIPLLLKHGGNIVFDRVTGKIATVFFNVYASKLGTELYAIHSVCYTIGVFTEYFTDTLSIYVISTLNQYKNKFQKCIEYIKTYSPFIFVAAYMAGYILLVFIHGSVSIRSCILWAGLYCTQVFALVVYETFKGYLTVTGQTNYLRFGGLCGIIVRIPFVYIGYKMNLGLLPFAIATGVDFAIRGVYFYICSLLHCKQNLIQTSAEVANL